MAIAWTDVEAIAPELSSTPAAAQTMILDHVNVAINTAVFGGEGTPKLKLARVYLAAHFGTITAQGAGGQVVAESAGGLSASYGTLDASRGLLGTTVYGRTYQTLAATSAAARAPRVI